MEPKSGKEGTATDSKKERRISKLIETGTAGTKIEGANAVVVPAENDAETIQFGSNRPEANGSDLQSYPVGSSGLPLKIGADMCRTEVQCSVFGSKSVEMVEMDRYGGAGG